VRDAAAHQRPCVLAGHSYGGAAITNAATGNPDVKALVYVDAFIPDQGENVFALVAAQPGSCLSGDPAKVFDLMCSNTSSQSSPASSRLLPARVAQQC